MTICTLPSTPQHQHASNEGKKYVMHKNQQTLANMDGKILGVDAAGLGGDADSRSLIEWKWPTYSGSHAEAGKLVHPLDLLDLGYQMPLCSCAFDPLVTQAEACTANLGKTTKDKGNRIYLTCHLFNAATATAAKQLKKAGHQVGTWPPAPCGYFVELSVMYANLTSTAISDLTSTSEDEGSMGTRSGASTPQKGNHQYRSLFTPGGSQQSPLFKQSSTLGSSRSSTKRPRHYYSSHGTPSTPTPKITSSGSDINIQGIDQGTRTKPVAADAKPNVADRTPPPSYIDTRWMSALLTPPGRKSAKNAAMADPLPGTAENPFIVNRDSGHADLSAGSDVEASASPWPLTQATSIPRIPVNNTNISLDEFLSALDSPTGLTSSGFTAHIWICPACGVYVLANRRDEHEGTMYCGGTY
ncbi:hypothetical protein FRC03_009108 [Tulasnella sp. 419]|nr:hypothetical protein FRC02_011682 [Tulasnella sp. 418]KAG8958457.1 hypothetical protein FRC03_009108 [Tulasnella sp. 419]